MARVLLCSSALRTPTDAKPDEPADKAELVGVVKIRALGQQLDAPDRLVVAHDGHDHTRSRGWAARRLRFASILVKIADQSGTLFGGRIPHDAVAECALLALVDLCVGARRFHRHQHIFACLVVETHDVDRKRIPRHDASESESWAPRSEPALSN